VTSRLSSNLLRLARFLLCCSYRHFCANLLNLSKFRCRVKLRFRGNQELSCTSTAGRFSCLIRSTLAAEFPCRRRSHCAKFSNNDQRLNRPAHSARTRGLASWVMQWGCSLRDSLQGLGMRLTQPRPTLRTGFPLPTRGRPHGHREAPLLHLQLFKSSTRHSYVQLANRLVLSAISRLPENNNHPPTAQPDPPVERFPFLWESPSPPRQLSPKRALQSPAGSLKSSGAPS